MHAPQPHCDMRSISGSPTDANTQAEHCPHLLYIALPFSAITMRVGALAEHALQAVVRHVTVEHGQQHAAVHKDLQLAHGPLLGEEVLAEDGNPNMSCAGCSQHGLEGVCGPWQQVWLVHKGAQPHSAQGVPQLQRKIFVLASMAYERIIVLPPLCEHGTSLLLGWPKGSHKGRLFFPGKSMAGIWDSYLLTCAA